MAQSFYKEAGCRSIVAWVPQRAVDVARPMGRCTQWLHVGAGQARDFATATPECPHLIYVDAESMEVVWRWRSMLRVRRGRDCTQPERHAARKQAIAHAVPHVFPQDCKFDLNATITEIRW